MSNGKLEQPRPGQKDSPSEVDDLEKEHAPGRGNDRAWAQQRIGNALKAWRKADGQGGGGNVEIPEHGGAALDAGVRRKMEPRLGADLSDVKVHAGGDSAKAAKDLGARAFTVGNAVHFGDGEYQPGSKEGDKLIAHELTHVAQGGKSGVQRKADGDGAAAGGEHVDVSKPDDPAEKEADQVADGVATAEHGDEGHEHEDEHGGAAGGHGKAAGAHGKAAGGHGKDGGAAPAQAPKAAVSAKRLPGISLATKPGTQPAATGPGPGGGAKASASDVAIKQTIEELKQATEDPLKLTATQLEDVLRTAWARIGHNQGPLYSDATAWAKKVQAGWDAAKAKAIAARFDKAITDLSPEHPNAEKLLAAVMQLIEKEQPTVRLLLTKTNEALQHSRELVRAKEAAHKQALATKEAEKKKKDAGGGDKDQKHDPDAHGGGDAGGQPGGGGGAQAHDAKKGGGDAHAPGGGAADPHAVGGAPGGGKDAHAHAPQPAAHDVGKGGGGGAVDGAQKADDKAKAASPTVAGPTAQNAPGAPPKPAVAPEPTPEELLTQFRSALTKKDATAADAAWNKVPASHRGLLTPEEVVQGYLVAAKLGEAMHKASMNPFAVNFALLDSPDAARALEAVHSTGQWHPFVLLAPTQGALTKKHQTALRPLVGKDKQTAQDLFGKAFVPAHDGPYPGVFAATTQATPWSHSALMRLWDALVTAGLPSAHIGASSGGMYLVSKELQNGKWETSSGAWYDDTIKACAFGTGAVSFNKNLDKNKDKKEAHNANEGYMPFFEGAALHEVGHAVGASFGGDDWSVQRNDFKAENGNAWSKALFNYTGNAGGVGSKIKNFFKGKKNVKPDDVRAYLIGRINGTTVLPTGIDEKTMSETANAEYKDTTLYKYTVHLLNGQQGYQFPHIEQCAHDGRVYYENKTFQSLGFASRFVSCKPETVNARVSVYSLASHKEWFAENYMAYYKTPNALGSKVAGDVKTYLDGVHKNPASGKVAQAGGKGAAPNKSKSEKQSAETAGGGGKDGQEENAAQDESVAKAKEEQLHRFSFPVNLG